MAVHGARRGDRPWPVGMSPPVFQSSTYRLDEAAYVDIARSGGTDTYWYTRLGNPTIDAVAAKVAALEGADSGLVFASGMAAITATVLAMVPSGGRIVAARELYGDAYTLLRELLPSCGRKVSFVAVDDLAGWRDALDGADAAYVETLSNPMLRVADLPALARLSRAAGAVSIVDGTFTTPCNVRPVEHGFDLVLQSGTKYLGGHSDLIAGALAGEGRAVAAVRELAVTLGGCIDPAAAAMLDRSLKTLSLRMERHNASALMLAQWLEGHSDVLAVSYPLLDSHPDTALAHDLMAGGSGIVTLRVSGGDARGAAVMNALELITQATSLGGVESLVSAPHNTSHLGLTEAERLTIGILPGTLRLSVGVEDVGDLIEDLQRALTQSAPLASAVTAETA